MPKHNPYEPISKEEQLKMDNEKKELKERLEAITRLAAECLDDPKFKKFKEEFERYREDILDKLAQPLDVDPIKDAYYLRACINTILILDKLLNRPKQDLKKGV